MKPERVLDMVLWAKKNSVCKNAGDKAAWVAKRNEWADDRRSLNVILNVMAFGSISQKYDEALDAWCRVAKAPDVELPDGLSGTVSGWAEVAHIFAEVLRKNRKAV